MCKNTGSRTNGRRAEVALKRVKLFAVAEVKPELSRESAGLVGRYDTWRISLPTKARRMVSKDASDERAMVPLPSSQLHVGMFFRNGGSRGKRTGPAVGTRSRTGTQFESPTHMPLPSHGPAITCLPVWR